MRRFTPSNPAALADLERRARRACVTFGDVELPPGAAPARGRIGFEIDPATGTARLLVERGVAYRGRAPRAAEWFARAELRFDSFESLVAWIGEVFAAPTADARHANDLTDLEHVRRALPAEGGAVHVDEHALRRTLERDVRGQPTALSALVRSVAHQLARRTPRRPATLFAIGPTGVGKTRTAEVLGPALLELVPDGGGYSFLRLDMSEYQERHRISQLLGAPQGYVGYGDSAQLIDALGANPRTIVLFDEIEKAHPDVLRALMNAMDAGRLSAARGQTRDAREIDCRRAIFFFTSNLDASAILAELEQRGAAQDPTLADAICRDRVRVAGVPPELVGRIASFLVFHPLDQDTRAEIASLAIARVAAEYGIEVSRIDPALVIELLDSGASRGYGARPLEYRIDTMLGTAFAAAARTTDAGPFIVAAGNPPRCHPAADPGGEALRVNS